MSVNLTKSLSDFQHDSLFDQVQLLRTTESLGKQCVFISFFGAQNCGKSTLLNALLGDKWVTNSNCAHVGKTLREVKDDKFSEIELDVNSCADRANWK